MTDVQQVILNIFKDVSKLIEKLNLRYYAIGGTCLGAVRHQGFIPWDDDLDIAMPLDDYLQFIEKAPYLLPDYLELNYPINNKHLSTFWLKVVDKRTTAIEDYSIYWKESYSGIWIDIFPLSGVPESKAERALFERKFKTYCTLSRKQKYSIRSQLTVMGKLIWILYSPLRFLLPQNYYWNKWISELKEIPFDDSVYTGVFCSENVEKIMLTEYFSDYSLLQFEDTMIRCPKDYDGFLTSMFGNYMVLPPKEKQNSGHKFNVGTIDVKTPYNLYRSGAAKISKR